MNNKTKTPLSICITFALFVSLIMTTNAQATESSQSRTVRTQKNSFTFYDVEDLAMLSFSGKLVSEKITDIVITPGGRTQHVVVQNKVENRTIHHN